jgi:MFS superfamily sulfate permease-like transporter
LQDSGVEVVGDIPVGLPELGLAGVTLADVQLLLLPAVGVLVVAYNDNIVEARAFAARTGDQIDANAELLALAGTNAASCLVRGMPVSSSGSRTVIGLSSGSRSQLFSLVMAVGVVVALLVFRPVLEAFPVAALGGIVVYAALRLINFAEFRRLLAFRRNEFLLAIAAMLGVLVLGILYGVLLAIALSVAELLYRVARPHDGILGIVPGLAGMHDIDDYPEAELEPGLIVYRYDSPLFFANAQDFRRRALAAVAEAPAQVRPVRWFLLNAEANIEVDSTAIDALEDVRSALAHQGVVFAMARVKQDLRVVLDRAGFSERVGDDLIFPTLPTALAAYRAFAASDEAPDAPPGR